MGIDGRALDGEPTRKQRQHREAMARNSSPQGPVGASQAGGAQTGPYPGPRQGVPPPQAKPRVGVQDSQWDGAGWDEPDEAAGHRARKLLSGSGSGIHRIGDRVGAMRRWMIGERWVKRLAVAAAALAVIFVFCFGGLWWRLGAGPINLDIATPWLASAIEENIGHGNTVEIGGTQIERAGRIRIAVRIRDIVVRDRDRAIVATAPKAEVKLSGTALLMGRLRAESLNLVDAELAIRITPDGRVTVSAGDTAKPLATGVASKKEAGLPATFPRQIPVTPPTAGAPQPATTDSTQAGILAGLDWLDSLSLTGLDGQNLNEIGLKNGNLLVDDQQRGNKWSFENISLSMRRPSGGGVAVRLGDRHGAHAWVIDRQPVRQAALTLDDPQHGIEGRRPVRPDGTRACPVRMNERMCK